MKNLVGLIVVLFCCKTIGGTQCDPRCGTGVYTHAGTCQPSGKCLCFWGWTGPNATYTTNNRILADYCRVPCHYTHDHANPACVDSNHTKQECQVPKSSTPSQKCDPRCGKPPYHGRGICLSDGRCLCWWGWTGPEACYVDGGTYNNRIIADYCVSACHYTHFVRNATCLNGSWAEETATQKASNEHAQVAAKCDPKCGTGVYTHAGTCQRNGKCLCWWGWTGQNAKYTKYNRILADYCRVPCNFTHDYRNPKCVDPDYGKHECEIPSINQPPVACDPRCNNLSSQAGEGRCLRNGRCLCWWGWTGPNACYLDGGFFNNRVLADYCEEPCHYTHDVRNATCLNKAWTGFEITEFMGV